MSSLDFSRLKKVVGDWNGLKIDCYITDREFQHYNKLKREASKKRYLESLNINFLIKE